MRINPRDRGDYARPEHTVMATSSPRWRRDRVTEMTSASPRN